MDLGDYPLSPILFNLFVSDLPDALTHQGPTINNTQLQYIQYADDLVLLATTAEELQNAINALQSYCQENGLQINTNKTKAMVYHKGRLPATSFHINNVPMEIVKTFNYVGFTFTQQLSFTHHLNTIMTKAKAKHKHLCIDVYIDEVLGVPFNVTV
ncbi:uncharacterized protein LOC131889515 [Tigriopus californicus]|uniref:uncharacterized protein LOC131889515 n=1 Tax=Tigriopus californicus TaxID=6832 RepID=UPI0027DA2A31|nr:uncharacterized protein LOC131889515 [Tigriopus californicus]